MSIHARVCCNASVAAEVGSCVSDAWLAPLPGEIVVEGPGGPSKTSLCDLVGRA